MSASERQTAPPPSEVVSVTFRVCVQVFEARPRGTDVFCDSPRPDSRKPRALSVRAEVYPRFTTEFESAASASRIRSVSPVGCS